MKEVIYEFQSRSGGEWVTLEIFEEKAEALKFMERMNDLLPKAGYRVCKVTVEREVIEPNAEPAQ